MGTTLSKLFGNGSKKNNNAAEPGAGQSATLPRPTTSKVKVDVPKKSSSFRLPFPKKSKTPSPAVTPKIPPKNLENVPTPTPALNVIEVQIDEEAFKKTGNETMVERIHETVTIIKTELESVAEDVKNEGEENVENAVVKIQAGVRGFLTRKHMKEGSSPDKEFGTVIVQSFDNNDKRIETPTPSSPLKTTFSLLESIPQPEERPEVPLEELEILKKVQEINQLFAKDDDDEQFKMLESVQTKLEQSADTVINTVETVLGALDANIEEAEKEPIVVESAFSEPDEEKSGDLLKDGQDVQFEELEQSLTQQVPIHLYKSPSLETDELENEDEKKGLSAEDAAIRIQAAFRGYGVRKSLSREPSPGREKIEDEVRALAEETQALLETEAEKPEPVPEVEPVIEAVTTKAEVQAVQDPEPDAAPIEEQVIVPVIVQHQKPENDVIEELPEPEEEPVEDNSTVINEQNRHEIEKLESLVSDDILADTSVPAAPEVPVAEPEPHSPPVEEEPFTKVVVETKELVPVVGETVAEPIPETIPTVEPETEAVPEPQEETVLVKTDETPVAELKEEAVQEVPEAANSEAQTLEKVIESLSDDKDSLVMKIKIDVESQSPDKEEKGEQDGDESDEDVSSSMPVNRESSPASSGNKRRNRNRNKNRKR